jgi:putative ubiquitin-RnfH superfamily antitoxin RatB of RatAB toxin-antitoxin module
MVETLIDIEVAYANLERQELVALQIPVGTTVEQAIYKSGLLSSFPEIDVADLKVGIFGNVCKVEQLVKQADRIEIYRPLIHDPKEARRQRAIKE